MITIKVELTEAELSELHFHSKHHSFPYSDKFNKAYEEIKQKRINNGVKRIKAPARENKYD